jgi:hypothetical protein
MRRSAMKRLITLISVMAVSMFFSAIGILAEGNSQTKNDEDLGTLLVPQTKNECLLLAKNCTTDYSNVQDRIIALVREIAKGLDVYTPSELDSLKEQLRWIENDSGNDKGGAY